MRRIAIHGAPRSGSSWLGEIVNSSPAVIYKYQPMFAHRFRGLLGECAIEADVDAFFREIVAVDDAFCDQAEARKSGRMPTFTKETATHVAYKEVRFHHLLWNLVRRSRDVQFLFLIRNPMATIASWLGAPREFRADLGWAVAEEWRYAIKKNLNRPEEFNGYERWKDSAAIFDALAARYPERVKLISYRHLVSNTQNVVSDLFDFCDLPITDQTRIFLDVSRQPASEGKRATYGVYNGRDDDREWEQTLPKYIVDDVARDLHGHSLEKFLDW